MGSGRVSRPLREVPNPALLRSRFRILFFAGLAIAALTLGQLPASVAAAGGLLLALLSFAVARTMGLRLAHSFVVVDWLMLGCVLAAAGGVHSWLLAGVPLLAAAYLGVSPGHEKPYLLAPSLVLLAVLAINDPTLGGNKPIGVGLVLLLVAGGAMGGSRVSPDRRRNRQAPRLDPTTGFYTAERLPQIAAVRLEIAGAAGAPVSLVYVRLKNVEGMGLRPGSSDANALFKGIADSIHGVLERGDVAFRLPPDAFAILLPGRDTAEARQTGDRLATAVSSQPIVGRHQSLAFGVATFPAAHSVSELLSMAKAGASSAPSPAKSTTQPLPVAAAQ